jgi:hypothetical protein
MPEDLIVTGSHTMPGSQLSGGGQFAFTRPRGSLPRPKYSTAAATSAGTPARPTID